MGKNVSIKKVLINKGKTKKTANVSRCLTGFEVFFNKPVADLLKIPAPAFIFSN